MSIELCKQWEYIDRKKRVGICRVENLIQSLCIGGWRVIIFYGGQFIKCEVLGLGDFVSIVLVVC